MSKRKAVAKRELINTGKDKRVAARAEAAGNDAPVRTAYRTGNVDNVSNCLMRQCVLVILKALRILPASAFGPAARFHVTASGPRCW